MRRLSLLLISALGALAMAVPACKCAKDATTEQPAAEEKVEVNPSAEGNAPEAAKAADAEKAAEAPTDDDEE